MPTPSPFSRGWNTRVVRPLLLVAALYPCWLGMMAVHEAGHVLHAWASGGKVAAVHVPLVGFSITRLASNPHPLFVAWGGVVWGGLIPLAAWAVLQRLRLQDRGSSQFFAGFCLVANGAYVGIGWTMRAGDAADLIRHGTPVWVLVVIGAGATCGGLLLWHLLGKNSSPPPSPPRTGERA